MVVQIHGKNTKRPITIQILLLAVQHIVHDGLLAVEIFRVFQGVGGDAHFFLAFQINLRRVEAVTLLGLRVVRFRYTECFRPFVVLRRGVAMVVLDSLCVLFHL